MEVVGFVIRDLAAGVCRHIKYEECRYICYMEHIQDTKSYYKLQ